jgi:hypothetical protein
LRTTQLETTPIYSNLTQNLLHFNHINMSNRAIPALGAIAAGGVGYYLYTAGGDPKLAEKKAERKFYLSERSIDLD